MAPIPKDNKEKPADRDEAEIDMFSNPNLVIPPGISDSSDENDDENVPSTAGYTLLSQEPGEMIEDDDDEDEDDNDNHLNGRTNSRNDPGEGSGSSAVNETNNVTEIEDTLPDTIIQSETGTSTLTVVASNLSCHPAFLAKFPDGKIPAYMQVPSVHSNSKELLWNQKRQEKQTISMDSGQESRILKAMAGFSLPKEHVPDWARNLSDDQWKKQILPKISPGEKHVTWPDAAREKRVSDQSKGEGTRLSQTEPNCDWVATFPDS